MHEGRCDKTEMHERRGREDGHRRREKAETITSRVLLGYTIIGVADDVLVVLTLRERNLER